MARNNDEYRFDPALEDGKLSEEYGGVTEEADLPREFAEPPAPRESVPEFGGSSGGPETDEEGKRRSRRELIKRMMFVPIAASLAALSIIFAAFNFDPLGGDFLASPAAAPSVSPSPASTESDTSSPTGDETEPADEDSTADEPPAPPEYTDSFPTLPNLDPDFLGIYAWSGMGSEEYVVIDAKYLHAGTIYTSGGTPIDTVEGASYDKATNTLTLNNYHGGFIDVNLMGNGFKIELIGDNSLDYIKAWGAMYGGSVTFTGTGSIKLNENRNAPNGVGLYLECEDSPSCVMIDRHATVEVFGDYAIVIHRSTLEKAIYTLEPIRMTGGKYSTGEFVEYTVTVTDGLGNVVFDENGDPVTRVVTVKDISKDKGVDLYDYSVVGDDGKPAKHVLFAPEE
ncbi:MAG: hypothetical protein IJS78_01655 [Clostridia bacterium]|nr:hypothetical protein [Clostridia bacterium]